MKKVVFISHGHPKLSKGGAEVASWNLYKLYLKEGFDCTYIARTDRPSHGGSTFSKYGEEILFHTGITDWFNLSSSNLDHLFKDLSDLLSHINPDFVHIHHYAHIGIELFPAVKKAVPKSKIIFTLHEFMAICMHNGQMVKRETLELCHKAVEADCHNCFKRNSPSDFFLRKSYVQDNLSYVDAFISPSEFLARRYIDWGLPSSKVHVIENVLPNIEKLTPRAIADNEKRSNLAFFGQINPFKGIDVLLEAILLLPENVKSHLKLSIHGANLDIQTSAFKDKIERLIEAAGENVELHGPYNSDQIRSRMMNCDWVIIPSIWWENSPVVIQEAVSYGRPLIGSDIGGMREKIKNQAGLTFEVRNPQSLADNIVKAIEPETFKFWHSKLSAEQGAKSMHLKILDVI